MTLRSGLKRRRVLPARGVGRWAVWFLAPTIVLASVTLEAPREHSASAAQGSLEEIATIPINQVPDGDLEVSGIQPSPLAVDEANNLGFAAGKSPLITDDDPPNDDRGIFLYDLESLELVDTRFITAFTGDSVFTWAVDSQRKRVFAPSGVPGSPVAQLCNGIQPMETLRYTREGDAWRWVRPQPVALVNLPCPNRLLFSVEAASIWRDPETGARKLYLLGSYNADIGTRGLINFFRVETRDNDGQTMLVRQIDLDKIDNGDPADDATALDWEIDLRYVGCGRLVSHFIGRTGDSVVSYCTDPTPAQYHNPVAEQGYVVRIDLNENDQPNLVQPRDSEGKDVDCGVIVPEKISGPPPVPEQPLPQHPLPENGDGKVDLCRVPDPLNPRYGIVNADVRRTPALSGRVQPFLDAESGRLMLLTNDSVNGNAVWVFDVSAERFIGVMTHGQATATTEKNAAGFDFARGRAYLFSPNGVLVGPARQDPPLTTLRYQVLDDDDDRMSTPRIAVIPGLRRLVFPMLGQGYVVLRDDVPDPAEESGANLDYLTAQIPEEEGKTTANISGAAQAAGLHVVVPGGVTRIARQTDPACTGTSLQAPNDSLQEVLDQFDAVNEGAVFDGNCIWDRLVRAGNREFSLGQSRAGAGTSTGISAAGEPFAFASDDEATDHDVRSAGECERTKLEEMALEAGGFGIGAGDPVVEEFADQAEEEGHGEDAEQLREGYQQLKDGYAEAVGGVAGGYGSFCDGTHAAREGFEKGGGDRLYEEGLAPLPDMRTGTAGRDGRGFPAPKAFCAVSSGSTSDRQAFGERDEAGGGTFRSQAHCDRNIIMGSARSDSIGVALPASTEPLITVGSVWSRTSSQKSAVDGTATTAIAGAQDVRIGPLGIEIIQSIATTKAHGHTDTAHTDLKRFWCNITLNGEPIIPGCVDPDSPQVKELVDQLNQGVQRVRFSVPAANGVDGNGEGTPGGYQAVVFKDESVQAADATVNDDTSQTVPALQAVFYNDGSEGRSRVVVQFAGVRAESRYGIIPLPSFRVPDPPEFMPTDFGPTLIPGTPGTPGIFVPATPDEYGFVVRGARAEEISLTTDDRRPLTRGPLAALGGALKWLVENPREFALLFAMWTVLGIPVYQTVRRRSFEQALLE